MCKIQNPYFKFKTEWVVPDTDNLLLLSSTFHWPSWLWSRDSPGEGLGSNLASQTH